MNILVSGASGFIGSNLVAALELQDNFNIRVLSRSPSQAQHKFPVSVQCYQWNPELNEIDKTAFEDIDVVVNLAGENIANGRWTEKKKQRLVSSRLKATKLLIDQLQMLNKASVKFISASAVGIYGDRGADQLDESSSLGNGFLPELCRQWEAEAGNHGSSGIKSTVVRTGIVIGSNGGALVRMLTPFKLGLGGRIGSGNQFMSWIHIEDLVRILIYLINSENAEGIYNATAPNPVSNSDFTKILGKSLGRPTLIPVPALVLKAVLGDLSEVLLEGQNVVPKRLTTEKFNFNYPNLEEALKSVCSTTAGDT